MSNKPAKKETNLPATMDMEADAGSGFEGADSDSYAIPFLRILQKLSPQCDSDSALYNPECKPGMFINTVDSRVYSGEEGLLVIPCGYTRTFTKWIPRDQGGGFKGTITPNSPEVENATRNDRGVYVTDDGLELRDTRYHFVLYSADDKNWIPALITMTSTQIKKSRQWMSMMNGLKLDGKNGPFTPPMYSHKYRITTVSESKDDNTWRGWHITPVSYLAAEESHVYQACKDFRESVQKGTAIIDHGGDTEEKDETDKF